jgi:protein-tyrosine phosphatase
MDDPGFADIHVHAIPLLDDGATTLEEAIELLVEAHKGGATTVVTTPHGGFRRKWQSVEQLRESCSDLAEELESRGVSLSLLLGMENPLDPMLVEMLEQGSALSLNGSRYVLVELPYLQIPLFWEHVVGAMEKKGYTAVIAHPERQLQIQGNPAIVQRMVAQGVLVQVTAGSLLGHFGSRERRTAEWLLDRDLADIVASDAHSVRGDRSPALGAAYKIIARRVGDDVARRVMVDTPHSIVDGQPISRHD